jgi:hypothetical protein
MAMQPSPAAEISSPFCPIFNVRMMRARIAFSRKNYQRMDLDLNRG